MLSSDSCWSRVWTTGPAPAARHRISLKSRYMISYWDAAILSAAQALGCHTVYSEDLNDG
jgi:predicted nucleic acid-binding protein